MRKITVLLLVIVMCVASFAACGGENNSTSGNGNATTTAAPAKDTTYDVGQFSVTVPDGWLAVPVKDAFGADPSANKTDSVTIYKGAKSELDVYGKPSMEIVFYDATEGVMPPKTAYKNVVDLEAFAAGTHNWTGFTAESGMGKKLILLWEDAGDLEYQVAIWPGDDADVTLENDDVKKIIGSITANKAAGTSAAASATTSAVSE